MISQPAKLVRDILTAQAGAVNALMKQYGPDLTDFATAIIPARGAGFDALLEDIFVDILSQIRAAETTDDDSMRRFMFESATRTLRVRHRAALASGADAAQSKTTFKHGEVLRELKMSEAQLAAAVSEGLIRAFREDDTTKFRAEDLRAMMRNGAASLACLSASERELLALHFRFGFAPDLIARWTSQSPTEVEDKIDAACRTLVKVGIISEALA